MKTLVIHPHDESTFFLMPIYEGKNWKVINYNPSNNELKKEISEHERIVMLGHGSPKGLYGFNKLLINSQHVYLLREKDCVCIWCHADVFVKRYELRSSFYTGMMISEMKEANIYQVQCTEKDIACSNMLFSKCVGESINSKTIVEEVQKNYLIEANNIADFNRARVYALKS